MQKQPGKNRRLLQGRSVKAMIYLQKEEIIVRDMEETDCSAICKAEEDESEGSMRYYEKQFGHIREKMCAGLTAVCQGEIAGYVYLYYQCKWGGLGNRGIPGVVDLSVMEKFRRRGIGNLLMDTAERIASEYSSLIYLDVGLNSEFGSAQRLYVKRGYIPDGKGCYYEDKICDIDAPCRNSDELSLCLVKKLR